MTARQDSLTDAFFVFFNKMQYFQLVIIKHLILLDNCFNFYAFLRPGSGRHGIDIAKGKGKLAKEFIPDNELCQACQLLQKCATDKTKSERAIERIHYLHTMEPLLKKSVTLGTEDRDIRVGFTTYGNKHLFSDTFGRSSVMTKDDLAMLDKVLETANFIDSSPLTHPRNDGIDRFFYYEATIRGQKVRLNVARKVKIRKDGRHITTHFLYSVNDIKKSIEGDG